MTVEQLLAEAIISQARDDYIENYIDIMAYACDAPHCLERYRKICKHTDALVKKKLRLRKNMPSQEELQEMIINERELYLAQAKERVAEIETFLDEGWFSCISEIDRDVVIRNWRREAERWQEDSTFHLKVGKRFTLPNNM